MLSDYERELSTHYAQVRARLRGAPPKIISAPVKMVQPEPPPPEPVAVMKVPEVFDAPDNRPFAKTTIICKGDFVSVNANLEQDIQFRRSFTDVLKDVSRETGVPVKMILGHRRHQFLVDARHLLFYRVAVECPHLSIADIGRRACKDHTTVLHGLKRHAERFGLPYARAGVE